MTDSEVEQREELARSLASGDVPQACNALLAVVNTDSDADWLQTTCLGLLTYPDAAVSGLAATCLGHVARLHGVARDDVVDRLEALRSDPNRGGRVDDALEDIAHYAG